MPTAIRVATLATLATLAAATALVASSSPAHAQGAKKSDSKKGDSKKSDSKKSDSKKGEASTPDANAVPPEPEPEAPAPPPADDAPQEGTTVDAASAVEPPAEVWDVTDVEEIPGRKYFFVGLRYRGNIVPRFMLNMFVEGGETIYTNMIGAEFDLRKDGFSLVPALSYQELGTGDILFKQKGTPDISGNYSVVNSGMKLLYATVDLLWSTPLSKTVEFEYGAGFGLGAVFGDLENSWVQEDPSGSLHAANGKNFKRCETVLPPGTGCNRADHQNSDIDKVNGYKEPSWFDGGSKPVLFPWISIPQVGLRFKPVKNFVGRLGVGFALTGFWFGLNAQYGLETKRDR